MPGPDWPGFHLQPATHTHIPQKNKYRCNQVGAVPLKMAIFLSTRFKSNFVISASAFESWLSVSLVLCFHGRGEKESITLSTVLRADVCLRKKLSQENMHESLLPWVRVRVCTNGPAPSPGQAVRRKTRSQQKTPGPLLCCLLCSIFPAVIFPPRAPRVYEGLPHARCRVCVGSVHLVYLGYGT